MKLGALLVTAALALPQMAAAEAQTLSIPEARSAAFQALQMGDAPTAYGIARTLLTRDPYDMQARVLYAQANLQMKQFAQARAEAKFVWDQSDDRDLRLQAAQFAARAAEAEGRTLVAKMWLRRAANLTQTEAEAARLASQYDALSARSPWTTQVALSVAPSSNINGGTSTDTFEYLGLPFKLSPDAQALSGVEMALNAAMTYRLSGNAKQRTDVGLNLSTRDYRLSDTAQEAAPDTSAAEFAYRQVEVSLTHQRKFDGLDGPTRFALAAGRSWRGGEELADNLRASVMQDQPLNDTFGLRFGVTGETSWPTGGTANTRMDLTSTLVADTGQWGRFTVGLGVGRAWSDNVSQQFDDLSLDLGWSPDAPVLGMSISLEGRAEYRDWDLHPYDISGRQDLLLGFEATAVVDQIQYFGFSPSVSIDIELNNSNISLFDRKTSGLRLGFASQF